MGLFALALIGDDEDHIRCAITNLQIYLDYINEENRLDYLLDFASGYIEEVKKNKSSNISSIG